MKVIRTYINFVVVLCQQEFITSPSSVLVTTGDNATLACLVRNMAGECRWQKNGKPVGLHPGKYSMPGVGEKGDCSISIARVDLRIDDGEWECQVGIIIQADHSDHAVPGHIQ